MLNELIIAGVNNFTSGKTDKNGKSPVVLNVVAGTFPNRNVLSGTVAESLGIQVGKSYIFSVREVEESAEYGRQFVYTVVSEISGLDLIKASKELGQATLINVDVKSTKDVFANAASEFEKAK